MGQYFRAINSTKREFVDPWDIDGLAKLWEWCTNRTAGIFPYLLRHSSEEGGGDIFPDDITVYAGRWAGDQVYLIGDYDKSGLFETVKSEYINIPNDLVDEYNKFIGIDSRKLEKAKLR